MPTLLSSILSPPRHGWLPLVTCLRQQMATVAPQQLSAAQANTYVDQKAALNIDSQPFAVRLSGIICTIGG